MEPNKERLRLWVEDLRTTEVLQGRGKLRAGDAFCCLGRGCEVFRRETGEGEWDSHGFFIVRGYDEHEVMPFPVAEWFGVDDNPSIYGGDDDQTLEPAAEFNDAYGYDFKRIANGFQRTYNLASP